MSSPVKLYVYDLSNGLARQLSLQLTGRQIDGIWHTSIVVFGKEVFYGQGISMTNPGQSHHGQPLQVIDMGETAIDEETFNDYINEMNDVYTADKYHLLDFNCNSFTDDCIGFLTGGSIPSWIKDLPSDFLSTPFGAALRPTIDNMYRRPTPGSAATAAAPPPQTLNTPLASSLLQSVASQAGGSGSELGQVSNLNSNSRSRTNGYPAPTPVTPQPETNTVAAPLQVCSNQQHFNSILGSHRGVVAFFTSRTCPPCRVVEPVFEEIALNKASSVGSRAGGGNGGVGAAAAGKGGIAFVKVDLGGGGILGGGGQVVASTYGVRVTPTFLFFVDGKKVYELKGADVGELRTQIDLLVYQIFPPHPHTKKNLKAIRSLSLDPILFEKVPPLDQVQAKLFSFIESIESGQSVNSNSNPNSGLDAEKVKKALSTIIIPFLKTQMHEKVRGAAGGGGGGGGGGSSSRINTLKPLAAATTRRKCEEWVGVTEWVGRVLVAGESESAAGVGRKEEGVFPLIDLWRVGLLDRTVSGWCASLWVDGQERGKGKMTNPILMFLENATKERGNGEGTTSTSTSVPKNVLLTTLRLVTNAFGNVVLARALLLGDVQGQGRGRGTREMITRLVVGGLLSEDSGVRSAAASLAFNVSAFYQRGRVEGVRGGSSNSGGAGDVAEGEEEGDWEVEMVSAVVEALRNEKASEDVVHRLVASLAFFLHLSPVYESHLEPLLEVLQVKDILRAKLKGAVAGNEEGGFGEKGVEKKEVRVLIEEVAEELCS